MKIRTGFVSNSSSSSFIVQCKQTEYSVDNKKDFDEKFEDIFGYDMTDLEDYEIDRYNKYLKFAQESWDNGEGILFEWIDQNAVGELDDIFIKMGLKCIMGDD